MYPNTLQSAVLSQQLSLLPPSLEIYSPLWLQHEPSQGGTSKCLACGCLDGSELRQPGLFLKPVSPPPLLSTEGGAEINKENDHHPPDTIESKERDASHFTNYPGQFLPSTMYVMNSVMFNLFFKSIPYNKHKSHLKESGTFLRHTLQGTRRYVRFCR
jgi:hypothetical protein